MNKLSKNLKNQSEMKMIKNIKITNQSDLIYAAIHVYIQKMIKSQYNFIL